MKRIKQKVLVYFYTQENIFLAILFLSRLRVSNLQATQCSDTICSGPALKIGKVPVYSANPWINSFAHTVYDGYHNIASDYYTKIQCLRKYSLQLAQHRASFERVNSGNFIHGVLIIIMRHRRSMLVEDSKPLSENLTRHQNNLQQEKLLQRSGSEPYKMELASDTLWTLSGKL